MLKVYRDLKGVIATAYKEGRQWANRKIIRYTGLSEAEMNTL